MTYVGYPDLQVANGTYRAEALSPSNGKISRDGSRPVRSRYADTQFRYQLLEGDGSVLWEHWQKSPRPHQLYLADDGWLVVRTHEWGGYFLIAVSPRGDETIRVSILPPGKERPLGPSVVAPNAVQTTAGMFWARASLTLFLTHEGERYFSFFPSWGERFVINLTRGELTDGPTEAIEVLEEKLAEDVLTSPNPVQDVFTCLGVIALIQRRQIGRLVPPLQALWRSKRSREHLSTQCSALPGVEQTSLQPLPALCLVLAAMGALGPGPACYSFTPRPPKMAQEITDRPERIAQLSDRLDALQVLELVGCPDHIDHFRGQDAWGSQWDYYTQNPLEVTRILWEPGSEGRNMRSLIRVPFTPADVEQRLRQLLRS